MKRLIISVIAVMSLVSACHTPVDPTPENPLVVLPEGTVLLEDAGFGMYYGDLDRDGMGLFSLVLSDARCYQDELDNPYMDSEGDMLVLKVRTAALAADAPVRLPAGDYSVSDSLKAGVVSASESYLTRFVGEMQSKWELRSGTFSVTLDDSGEYQISTADLVVAKDGQTDTLEYVCFGAMTMEDYMSVAAGLVSTRDDIIDMPFSDFECIYNGDLFGNGTGNFIINMSTKGFVTSSGEILDVPGIYMTLNLFSRLYTGNSEPVLEAGRYTVSTTTSSSLFARWTVLPGLMMDTTPFGSYVLQQPTDGEGTMEFISAGTVDVEYPEEEAQTKAAKTRACVITYNLKTSGREISGVWKGDLLVDNQAPTTSTEAILTTLDHDVDCDMSKVTGGTLHHIETLHRDNVEEQWNYDIAEAWQLYLQPRGWTEEEKNIPWVDPENVEGADGIIGTEDDFMYDKNMNGIRDRLEAWCGDGDVMVLEFVLPLGSQGVIAPELGKTYVYTMQPCLEVTHEYYELFVSRMGRPVDEIFDPYYAEQFPDWAGMLGITDYDRTNARRGFTWSEDGFRGNWYLHYQEGSHQLLDGHAPAINGWVKVVRTADDVYDFEWEFIDDNPGTPNKIKGSMKDCKVNIQN